MSPSYESFIKQEPLRERLIEALGEASDAVIKQIGEAILIEDRALVGALMEKTFNDYWGSVHVGALEAGWIDPDLADWERENAMGYENL